MIDRDSLPVALAVYLLLFSVVPGIGTFVQLCAIAVLAADAAWQLGRRTVIAVPPSGLELALLAAGGLSLLVGALRNNLSSYSYSVIFLVAIGAAMLVVRSRSLAAIVQGIAVALGLMVVTILARSGIELVSILRTGSHRFWPFGLHPDLTGFVFGGAAVLFVQRSAYASGWRRLGLGALAVICSAIVLAASARAGLLAAAGTLAGWWVVRTAATRGVGALLLCLAVVVAGAAVLLPFGGMPIYRYLGGLLDLDSASRGWGSGATGRVETWGRTVALLFSSPDVMLFGLGLRTAEPGTIGFETESSYLNVLLESGLVVGGALLVAVMGVAVRAGRLLAGKRAVPGAEGALLVVAYCLLQSVFNRYLIAIGNPLSLALLLVMVKVSIEASAGARPPHPAFGHPLPRGERARLQPRWALNLSQAFSLDGRRWAKPG